MSICVEHIDFSQLVTEITATYRGRFAPTPSGPLHLGSLLTALASWLTARQAQGQWLLRIDDLDGPRCVEGAEEMILLQLQAHGLYWDGAPVRQTVHETEYRSALAQLDAGIWLYACTCTRAQLTATSLPGPDGPVYSGRCRHSSPAPGGARTLRFRVPDGSVSWLDEVQGWVQRQAPVESGDFVVRRADGQIGYHLACALDEQRMGITEVVRGADLLGSTVHQLQVMRALNLPAPRYAHVPVLLAADGRKLSKQNGAAALSIDQPAVAQQLLCCLRALQLSPAPELARADAKTILDWALSQWNRVAMSRSMGLANATATLP